MKTYRVKTSTKRSGCICPACAGTGKIGGKRCDLCDGRKVVTQQEHDQFRCQTKPGW